MKKDIYIEKSIRYLKLLDKELKLESNQKEDSSTKYFAALIREIFKTIVSVYKTNRTETAQIKKKKEENAKSFEKKIKIQKLQQYVEKLNESLKTLGEAGNYAFELSQKDLSSIKERKIKKIKKESTYRLDMDQYDEIFEQIDELLTDYAQAFNTIKSDIAKIIYFINNNKIEVVNEKIDSKILEKIKDESSKSLRLLGEAAQIAQSILAIKLD